MPSLLPSSTCAFTCLPGSGVANACKTTLHTWRVGDGGGAAPHNCRSNADLTAGAAGGFIDGARSKQISAVVVHDIKVEL